RVAVTAASGGLRLYEQTFMASAGSFPSVRGREVQAILYGYMGKNNVPILISPIGTFSDGSPEYCAVGVKSLAWSFPVLEWIPFRSFATRLAFAIQLQLGFGVELPTSVTVEYPVGRAAPNIPPIWSAFLRGTFDGRFFLGSKEDLGAAAIQQ
ncbi:MAG: hypothetical protein NTU88_00350, partial [Armatimonadetes bacterium]|nr:hypothetical protein [Armatimonadota bacterium]